MATAGSSRSPREVVSGAEILDAAGTRHYYRGSPAGRRSLADPTRSDFPTDHHDERRKVNAFVQQLRHFGGGRCAILPAVRQPLAAAGVDPDATGALTAVGVAETGPQSPVGAGPFAVLLVHRGPNEGTAFELQGDLVGVGRAADQQVF